MKSLRCAAVLFCLAALAPLAPRLEGACCYFAAKDKDITQPGQKAFVQWNPDEGIEAFTVQPKFEGNALDFGMVIPTPAQPKLDEMPRDFFTDLAIYTILLPLPEAIYPELVAMKYDNMTFGSGGVQESEGADDRQHGVKVLEAGVVGSLDYKIIVAEQAAGLFDWLKSNQYAYAGDESTLDHYIRKKWFFTVMKIDSKQMKKSADGSYLGEVTPTRFTFSTKECIYPLKITQLSVKESTDALFYVQAPAQMDLKGDWSWMHSYRTMYLTYLVGCGASPEEQKELEERNRWVAAKKQADPRFDTTKLEWARKLGDAELAVLDDPLKNYAQAGGGDLPPGATAVSLQDFLKEAWTEYEQNRGSDGDDEYARQRMKEMEAQYAADKGSIVRIPKPGGAFTPTPYMWYANREAPAEEVKGLSRLKGHLQQGRWVTKFRKTIRKDEMGDDLTLVPVDAGKEQNYVRIMPTSPP